MARHCFQTRHTLPWTRELRRLPRCGLLASRSTGGLFDLEAGKEGLEYTSGSFRARFHYYKPNRLLIATIQQGDFFRFKGSQVAPMATMFLRTEPSLLDQFIATLPGLDASDGGQAVLQCVPLPDDT